MDKKLDANNIEPMKNDQIKKDSRKQWIAGPAQDITQKKHFEAIMLPPTLLQIADKFLLKPSHLNQIAKIQKYANKNVIGPDLKEDEGGLKSVKRK